MDLKKEHLEFIQQFKEITENKEYCKLKAVPRHGSTNTFDHSVRVAYMAYHLAKSWGMDADSAARIGFLHDFCMIAIIRMMVPPIMDVGTAFTIRRMRWRTPRHRILL